ncbi:MAG: aminotransferase class I/II-fold pyridoxal phosphate-dependent enzyme, partial [Methanobrevibacter sp.]|nr:aminotransferase class I/II-fold pyridoxal phosphate-dependent enzyme [Methanobrevibacter sp.]
MKARQIVEEMDSYVPGKSQDEIASDFNLKKEDIIKLGSNENPWGPSPKAMKAIEDEIHAINRYPESQLHELVDEMAKYSGVKPSQVIIGGDGADEIIDVLAKTFIDDGDEFIVPLPSYMYYEYLLKQYGAKPVYAKWDLDANELDVDSIYDAITPKTKMIFLCSPNNPTGTLIDKDVLVDIAGKNPEILIVIDEAY